MNVIRSDRRIHKTRQHITRAFLSLCEKKEFEAIVVRDITDAADVSRSTFYTHFQDKYDLLEQIMKDKLAEISDLYESNKSQILGYKPHHEVPDPYFLLLFEHMSVHAHMYRVLLFHLPDSRFGDRMMEAVQHTIGQRIDSNRMDQKQPIPLDILLGSMAIWIVGIVLSWFKQGMMYSPNYMAIQLSRIASIGFYQAMSLKVHN
ncbi:TetR/AcrR family transcriptional regulator C-terminal domain-containing protein [Bacillus sp. 3255]|uniref:TetR/AcrR family transcriptional regulator n=1 Tax=Bacillus sp. 3255 TaxID=2817904 RepID=UPI002856373E|nr:TetR/AcrR family transcriptional regulator C-terminal domain-containing protein [Bacillus sp. 3255]MDR6880730.1 AcrR family transcriptional regulator [Bacillus sp. 3255]